MNNTHKLLLAFIEASGYEVEEVRMDYPKAKQYIDLDGNPYEVPIDGQSVSITTDYKVTKKKSQADEDYEAVAHLMTQFKKGTHETMTITYSGKTYTYNDKGELTIENL